MAVLKNCFHLVANITSESTDVTLLILQRANVIQVMTSISENSDCDGTMLKNIVWLASLLMQQRSSLGLTRDNKLKLCEIGKGGLMAIDSSIASDACWLFAYALDTEDD